MDMFIALIEVIRKVEQFYPYELADPLDLELLEL